MERLRSRLTPASHLKYLIWRLVGFQSSATFHIARGPKLIVRPWPADDLDVAYHVFVGEFYKSPRSLQNASIRRIVDLGANVGYTCLYWRSVYPNAEVIGFEPHPTHVAMIERHLAMNNESQHVTLYSAAAGTRDGAAFLSDEGMSSVVSAERKSRTIPIAVKDFFSLASSTHIDILKMDIEGGEYPILMDPRFGTLSIGAVVLEWHNSPEYPQGRQLCCDLLEKLGYEVAEGAFTDPTCGMLWAYSKDATALPSRHEAARIARTLSGSEAD